MPMSRCAAGRWSKHRTPRPGRSRRFEATTRPALSISSRFSRHNARCLSFQDQLAQSDAAVTSDLIRLYKASGRRLDADGAPGCPSTSEQDRLQPMIRKRISDDSGRPVLARLWPIFFRSGHALGGIASAWTAVPPRSTPPVRPLCLPPRSPSPRSGERRSPTAPSTSAAPKQFPTWTCAPASPGFSPAGTSRRGPT